MIANKGLLVLGHAIEVSRFVVLSVSLIGAEFVESLSRIKFKFRKVIEYFTSIVRRDRGKISGGFARNSWNCR